MTAQRKLSTHIRDFMAAVNLPSWFRRRSVANVPSTNSDSKSPAPLTRDTVNALQPVNLTQEIPYRFLPKSLIRTMWLIESAGPEGINTLYLQYLGCVNCGNQISQLRERGAVITTVPENAKDISGFVHRQVGRYFFEGWASDSEYCNRKEAA